MAWKLKWKWKNKYSTSNDDVRNWKSQNRIKEWKYCSHLPFEHTQTQTHTHGLASTQHYINNNVFRALSVISFFRESREREEEEGEAKRMQKRKRVDWDGWQYSALRITKFLILFLSMSDCVLTQSPHTQIRFDFFFRIWALYTSNWKKRTEQQKLNKCKAKQETEIKIKKRVSEKGEKLWPLHIFPRESSMTFHIFEIKRFFSFILKISVVYRGKVWEIRRSRAVCLSYLVSWNDNNISWFYQNAEINVVVSDWTEL